MSSDDTFDSVFDKRDVEVDQKVKPKAGKFY